MPIANRLTILRGFGAAACFAAVVCSAQEPASNRGAEVLKNVCGVCHTPQSVVARRRTRAQWQETIDKMVGLGAKASNIYWQVGSSATLGTTSSFKGNIMADQSITLTHLATLEGRALARIGAVTLDSNTVTVPA